MRKTRETYITASLKYERATLAALNAINGDDFETMRVAFIKFCDAALAFKRFAREDRMHAEDYLQRRGRVPVDAWKVIYLAMESVALTLGGDSENGAPN